MVLRIVPAQVEWLEQRRSTRNEALPADQLHPARRQRGGGAGPHRARLRAPGRAGGRGAGGGEPVNPAALAYLNRLSDYLFVLARAVNADWRGDVLWVPGQSRDR
jgi:cob(I)alamin adenosyltransferase